MHTSEDRCEHQDNAYKSASKTTKHSIRIKNHYYKYENYLEIWEQTQRVMFSERKKH